MRGTREKDEEGGGGNTKKKRKRKRKKGRGIEIRRMTGIREEGEGVEKGEQVENRCLEKNRNEGGKMRR